MFDTLETEIHTSVNLEKFLKDADQLIYDLKVKMNTADHQLSEVSDLIVLRGALKRAHHGLSFTASRPREMFQKKEDTTYVIDGVSLNLSEELQGVHRITVDMYGEVYRSSPQTKVKWVEFTDDAGKVEDGEWILDPKQPCKHGEILLQDCGETTNIYTPTLTPLSWIVDFTRGTVRRGQDASPFEVR